ncbi:PREDICTED: calcium uniporter protein 4, mitochondrial [Tarenaya hassleriana]|uniref:calcium uniporter protein 4, mitochondrial n=1 Tax=Tarenaya hassleriana TaxID=28532 RepID=UPI00053C425A|nr:PREDICTED: calcium uniporter protein 4, mitochondrial [Tarenaya hassleriana]
MALRRTLTKRIIDGYRSAGSSLATPEHFSPAKSKIQREHLTSPENGQSRGFLRRFLHRPVAANVSDFLSLPVGERLRERLTGLDSDRNRIRRQIEALTLPPPPPPSMSSENEIPETGDTVSGSGLTVSETKKLLRMYQVEKMKARLREIPKSSVTYWEFVQICSQGCGSDEQGLELAKSLDDSGNVIVLGDLVFLRPEQMAKSMEALINQTSTLPNDPRKEELIQLEKTKNMIDSKARGRVQMELYCGLGLLAAQTVGFMRLTFWELSWDVMEPICFFVASIHFLLGYVFFLRTSTEPSFEGFFRRRFGVKQKKLMEIHGFDLNRYNELKTLFSPSSSCASHV